MRTALSICLILLAVAMPAVAQKVTVSGFVTDAGSGERMIDATVYEKASFVRYNH